MTLLSHLNFWIALTIALAGTPGAARAATEVARDRGALIVAQTGSALALEVVEGDPQDVAFTARATLVEAGETRRVSTRCAVEGDELTCQGLGAMPLVPATEGSTTSFFVEVTGLGLEVTVLEFRPQGEVTESGVRFNWWTLSCELEFDDFAECDDACEARGYPGSQAIAQQSGSGCTLACQCYTEDGTSGGVYPEPDDFME